MISKETEMKIIASGLFADWKKLVDPAGVIGFHRLAGSLYSAILSTFTARCSERKMPEAERYKRACAAAQMAVIELMDAHDALMVKCAELEKHDAEWKAGGKAKRNG